MLPTKTFCSKIPDTLVINIKKATFADSKIIGFVHSAAWKQTYKNIFSKDFLNSDSAEKREKEFLDSLSEPNILYLIIENDLKIAGIVKLIFYEKFVEISSFYILQEFRKKGLGKQTFDFIKNLAAAKPLVLWVLKENTAARNFYEKVGMHFTNKTRVIKRGSDFVQYMYSTSF